MSTSYRKKAEELGFHSSTILDNYDNLKQLTHNNDIQEISELDIIYFLSNILKSTNYELIAEIIVDRGCISKLNKWKEAIDKLNNK